MDTESLDKGCVAGLGASTGRQDFLRSLTRSKLHMQEDHMVSAVTKQQAQHFVVQAKQLQAPPLARGEEHEIHSGKKPEQALEVSDTQQQGQALSVVTPGAGRMEGGRREQLFSLASLVSEDGDEQEQQRGIGPQQLYRGKAELCDDEEEEEEHHQLPSTVDSVASSTDSYGLGGGGRVAAELLHEAMCGSSSSAAAAAISLLACSKKLRSLSSTPLLSGAGVPEIPTPTLQAALDSPKIPALPLPLPAPLSKGGASKTGVTADPGGPKDDENSDKSNSAAAGEARTAKNKEEGEIAEDAAVTLAGDAMQKKEEEEAERQQVLEGRAITPAAMTAVKEGCGSAALLMATSADAGTAAEGRKKTETGEGGGRGGRGERGTSKISNGDDANGGLSGGKEEETAIMPFRLRKKQSAAEQGRIAAAAVAATTRLFSREEGKESNSSCTFANEKLQREVVVQMAQPQKGSAGGHEEKKNSFSLVTASRTTSPPIRPLQEQQKQQKHERIQPQPVEAEITNWRQHGKERQEEMKVLSSFGTEEHKHRQQRTREQVRQQQMEEQQGKQHGNKQGRYTQTIASELQKEKKTMLRTSCSMEEGGLAATAESPAQLLSQGGHLLSVNRSSMEQYQQHLERLEKLWAARSTDEAEKQHRCTLLSQRYLNSSASSLPSLLQQQHVNKADAFPALLFSAAALQHDMSTKHSSLATMPPRKTPPAGNLSSLIAAGAIDKEITDTLVTAASRDERTVWMTREDVTGTKRECYDFASFQEATSDRERIACQLSATERDVMLSLMDLPRVLSLTTQASSPDTPALDHRQFQQSKALSKHKMNDVIGTPPIATHHAAAAAAFSGAGGDAAAASIAASAALSRRSSASSTTHQYQHCLNADLPSTTVSTGGSANSGVAAPAACLSPKQGVVRRVEERDPSPVTSLRLQAAMHPPPGLHTQARECGIQNKHSQCYENLSGMSHAGGTASPSLISSSPARRHSTAAALLANATPESLAAAMAALAAAASSPMGSAAAVPPGIAGGGLTLATADVSRRECLFSADDILRVAAAAAAGGDVGRSTCSNNNNRADDILNAASSLSYGAPPNWPFSPRKGSYCSNSNVVCDTASKQFLLAALAREAATGAGGAALAAAAARARQHGLAIREGETTLRLSQISRIGAGEGEAATMNSAVDSGGAFLSGDTEGAGCSNLNTTSYQGGVGNVCAGENENRAGPVFMRKHQVSMPAQKHRETQLQQHEGLRIMSHCGKETETTDGIQFFGAAATEGRASRRQGTERREMAIENSRVPGCVAPSSAFLSYGGRRCSGAGNNTNSVGRQAWLRKREFLDVLDIQQLHRGGNGRSAMYGRGVTERSNNRKTAAAREKQPVPEPQKDGFKVFFGNASALTTEEEMYGLFRQYGECSELILLRDRRQRLRGAGFVTYKNAADAMRAIEGLDRKYTVLGGTKPLEVRIPENSEQKRVRIRALARLRAENAQQQSQGKQQQQGNQQHLQPDHHPCRQQLQQTTLQQHHYVQQQRCLLSQQKQQQDTDTLHHAPQFSTSQEQQIALQQQQYSERQQHSYYEQQHRGGMSLQAVHQPHMYYEQQRGGGSLQGGHGFLLGDACERGNETTEQFSWQAGSACLLGASCGTVVCSPRKGENSEVATAAALPYPTTALEALLAAAAAQQQQTQQKEQQSQTSGLLGGTAERTQDLLAWLEGYTKYGEGGVVPSSDQQQQRQKPSRFPELPHTDKRKESGSARVSRPNVSLVQESSKTLSRSSTLHMGSTAEQIVTACIGEHHSEEEGGHWREAALNYFPGTLQGTSAVTLHQTITAALPPPRTPATTGMASDRFSCSTATSTGGGPTWQGSVSATVDQKTNASPVPDVTSAARFSPAVASPCSPEDVDAFRAALSTAASDGTAPSTAVVGAEFAPQRNKASPPACEEADLSYVNAVANVLSGRTAPPPVRGERDSAVASLSSRAPPSRYAASPCSYSRLAPSDAAFLQSASTASPAALSPFLPPFSNMEKSLRMPDSDSRDSKASAITGRGGAAGEGSLGHTRLSPPPQLDSGSRPHPGLYIGNGKQPEC